MVKGIHRKQYGCCAQCFQQQQPWQHVHVYAQQHDDVQMPLVRMLTIQEDHKLQEARLHQAQAQILEVRWKPYWLGREQMRQQRQQRVIEW